MKAKRGMCAVCREYVALRKDGKTRKHSRWEGAGFKPEPCPGTHREPAALEIR